MAFVRRRIDVTVRLGRGDYGTAGFDTVTLTGHRVEANVQQAGIAGYGEGEVRIYGVSLSIMNKIAIRPPELIGRINGMAVQAGDEGQPLATVYDGDLYNACMEMNAAPDTPLILQGRQGWFESIAPAQSSSYPGRVDVAVIMQDLARRMHKGFRNSGVTGLMLATPYLPGSPMEQAQRVADHADIAWNHGDGGIIEIWPKNAARGGLIPVLSPKTGTIIGYPTYSYAYLSVNAPFNPGFDFNQTVEIRDSVITGANGRWKITMLEHVLEAEVPNGAWMTRLALYPVDPPSGQSA